MISSYSHWREVNDLFEENGVQFISRMLFDICGNERKDRSKYKNAETII